MAKNRSQNSSSRNAKTSSSRLEGSYSSSSRAFAARAAERFAAFPFAPTYWSGATPPETPVSWYARRIAATRGARDSA